MKTFITYCLQLVLVVVLLGILVWWQISTWDECRETNSFWYCVRVLIH